MQKRTQTTGGPALPGLDQETIGLKDAATLCGVGHSARRLAALGIRPVNEVRTGKLTFRAYRRSDCEAYVARREAEERKRLEALHAGGVADLRDGSRRPTQGLSHSPASLDQVFAVLCECRNHLKSLTAQNA